MDPLERPFAKAMRIGDSVYWWEFDSIVMNDPRLVRELPEERKAYILDEATGDLEDGGRENIDHFITYFAEERRPARLLSRGRNVLAQLESGILTGISGNLRTFSDGEGVTLARGSIFRAAVLLDLEHAVQGGRYFLVDTRTPLLGYEAGNTVGIVRQTPLLSSEDWERIQVPDTDIEAREAYKAHLANDEPL